MPAGTWGFADHSWTLPGKRSRQAEAQTKPRHFSNRWPCRPWGVGALANAFPVAAYGASLAQVLESGKHVDKLCRGKSN